MMVREGVVVGVVDAIDALGGSMRDARASAASVAFAPASASTSAVEKLPLLGVGRTRAAAADSAAAGARARGVATPIRAALVLCATLAVAAVVSVSPGASRASRVGTDDVAFASLGAAGKKLGSGVRAERAGSATDVPEKPTPLEAFNPFADARGLKLDPRKLPPLTPAGLAKSQRATMMVDQVNAQWLQSSADAAREDGAAHAAPYRSRADENAEDGAWVPGSSRGGSAERAERAYDGDGAREARDDAPIRRRRWRAYRRSRSEVPPRDRDGYDSNADDGYRGPVDGYLERGQRWSYPSAAGGVILGGSRRRRRGGGGAGFAARRNEQRYDARYDDGHDARYDDGHDAWYDDGHDAWYDDGYADARARVGSRGRGGGFDVPLPRGRDGGGIVAASSRARGSREPFSFDPDPDATARSRSRRVALGSIHGAHACVLKRGVTDAQAQAVLDYACDPARADAVRGFSCAAIRKGGAAFLPNTKLDHAEWAVAAFFRARALEHDAFPQQDCHFAGVATLDVSGNFYLTADGGLVRANRALDALGATAAVPEGGVAFDTAAPFAGTLVDRVTGAWSETSAVPAASGVAAAGSGDRGDPRGVSGEASYRLSSADGAGRAGRRREGPATTFKFWAGAAPGTGGGCVLETSVSYDFDGDGTVDRVEVFQPQGIPEEPNLIPVESKVLGRDARVEGDVYWSAVTNARARLRVRSPNCPGAVRVWEAAEMYPSFLTVPYDDGLEDAVA